MQRRTILLISVALGVVAFLLSASALTGATKTKPVVVAKSYLPAGTIIGKDDIEIRQFPAKAVPAGAITDPDQAVGKILSVPRAAGDLLSVAAFEQMSIPITDPKMRAVALELSPAAAGGGLVRPGFFVDVIAEFPPDIMNRLRTLSAETPGYFVPEQPAPTPTPIPWMAQPTPTPRPAPAARIVVSGLRVLYVSPSLFAAEPQPQQQSGSLAPLRTTTAQARSGVVVLEVPVDPVDVGDGYLVSLPALLAILNNEANVHLAIAPPSAPAPPSVSVRLEEIFAFVAGSGPQPPPGPTPTPVQ